MSTEPVGGVTFTRTVTDFAFDGIGNSTVSIFDMAHTRDQLELTKKLMGALGSMPPKPHEKMKIGNTTAKKAKSPRQKRRAVSAKPKTA